MGTKKQAILSIVIPFYNAARFLDSLQASLSQFDDKCEIIFINDASTNAEKNKLESYAKKNNWVVIHNQHNQGPGCSRNNGIQKAKGEYIVFLDTDDEFSPTTYQKILNVINHKSPEIILFDVTGKTRNININYSTLPGAAAGWADPKLAFAFCRGMTAGKCYSRDFIHSNHIRYANMKYHEDTAFTKSALSLASKVYYLKESLYTYNLAHSSLALDQENASFESSFTAYAQISEHCPQNRLEELCYVYLQEVIISCMIKINSLKLTKKKFLKMHYNLPKTHPNAYHNRYFKKASLRYKIILKLFQYKMYYSLKIAIFLENMIRRIIGV